MGDREAELRTARDRRLLVRLESQLVAGGDLVRVADLGCVPRERAWAIAGSMRAALAAGGTFHPPTCDEHGAWWAHVTVPLGSYRI